MGSQTNRPRFRPSPGTVIACIALVVACTGTATAATLITGAQIKNNSVTTKDVKNKSLRARDFKPGDLPRGPAGPTGVAGPQGSQGPQGPQGPQGNPGLSGLEKVSASAPMTSASPKSIGATCPAGKQAIGADYVITGGKTGAFPDALLEVAVDQVQLVGDQGFADAYEADPTTETWGLFLEVVCVRVSP